MMNYWKDFKPEKQKFKPQYYTPETKTRKRRFEENYFQRTEKKANIQIDELLRIHQIEKELDFLRKYVSQLEVILFDVQNKTSIQNKNNYRKNPIEKQVFKLNYCKPENLQPNFNRFSQLPKDNLSQNGHYYETTPQKQRETNQKQKAFDANQTPQTQNQKKQQTNSQSQSPQNNYKNTQQFKNKPNFQEQQKTEKKLENKQQNQQYKIKVEEFEKIRELLNYNKNEKQSQFIKKEPLRKEKEDKVKEANEQKLEQQQEDNQFKYNQEAQNERFEEEKQVVEDQRQNDVLPMQFQPDQNRLNLVVQTIRQLIEASGANQRHIEHNFKYFVQEKENKTELFQNYSIKSFDVKKNLQKICDTIQKVRGDGNCFYTAFGYQFLELLLNDFSKQEYQQFINWIQEINLRFKIICENFQIDNQELETKLREQFLFLLQQLKNIESVEERNINLFNQFRQFEITEDGTGCLYPLSILFFRNLSDYLLEFNELKNQVFDRINLLIWEQECDNNELIISSLAQKLNLKIKLVFFQENDFNLRVYGAEDNKEIILLIHPGHYNIGKKTG